jgi:hypothetical protein
MVVVDLGAPRPVRTTMETPMPTATTTPRVLKPLPLPLELSSSLDLVHLTPTVLWAAAGSTLESVRAPLLPRSVMADVDLETPSLMIMLPRLFRDATWDAGALRICKII